jgi:hypothetical protein
MHRSETKKPVQLDQIKNLCRSKIHRSVDTASARFELVSPHANDPSDHSALQMADLLPEPTHPAHAFPNARTSHPESPHSLFSQVRQNHLHTRHSMDHPRRIFRRHLARSRKQHRLQTGLSLRHRSIEKRGAGDRGMIMRRKISNNCVKGNAHLVPLPIRAVRSATGLKTKALPTFCFFSSP